MLDETEMLLISWNVASWNTAVREIAKRHGSFDSWARDLGPDVLCLQETKLCDKDVNSNASALGALAAGYDSFWACNEGRGAQTKGLNGVCTFVRAGLAIRAERHPLRDPQLDGEGRCLLVELRGGVVVVNVYVPNSSDGRLPIKLRFLDALAALLAREHAEGKRVVLVGDLNLQSRALDAHWKLRVLDLGGLASAASARALDCALLWPSAQPAEELRGRDGGARAKLDERALDLARSLAAGYAEIASAMSRAEVREVESQNTTTGKRFRKYKVFVPVRDAAGNAATMRAVGGPCESREEACGRYRLGSIVPGGAAGADAGREAAEAKLEQREESDGAGADGARLASRREGEMCMERARDVASAVLGNLGDFGDEVWARLGLALGFVRSRTEQAVLDRFGLLLAAAGGLIDTFAHTHPHALDRFTCWDQFTQKRFCNTGARIDYILAPVEMLVSNAPSACGGCAQLSTGDTTFDANSAAAALAAATENGRWKAVSFAGGGFEDGDSRDYRLHLAHAHQAAAGIIYTPPQYSDHVAVFASLRYDFAAAQAQVASQTAPPNFGHDVQPFKAQLRQQRCIAKWLGGSTADTCAATPARADATSAGPASAAANAAAPPALATAQAEASAPATAKLDVAARKARPPASKPELAGKRQRGTLDAFFAHRPRAN